MKIDNLILHNYRIYKGHNNIDLNSGSKQNITVIAGKNGYGKTTFLTALVWVFYGRLIGLVEDKYRKDIKNAEGYENYLLDIFNKTAKREYEEGLTEDSKFYVEVNLTDLSIPSIPCNSVKIKRSYDLKTKEENLILLIDGDENELTKEVGYEVFINDFILPREIAKFFFFDAEKIVSLAEAKSKAELRNLSRAYSEVLGIKKYDELKKNLEGLLTRLRRNGVTETQKSKLDELIAGGKELEELLDYNQESQDEIDNKLNVLKAKNDALQEKLIREGNGITLEELKELKERRDFFGEESKNIKNKLKKLLELAPLVISGKQLANLNDQLFLENKISSGAINAEFLYGEIISFSKEIKNNLELLNFGLLDKKLIEETIEKVIIQKYSISDQPAVEKEILLDFSEEKYREFQALYNNLKTSYLKQFQDIVKEEKNIKILLNGTLRKIKQAEARKDNHLAKKYREEKEKNQIEIATLTEEKNKRVLEFGTLYQKQISNKKILSEYEKNFNLMLVDKKKYEVTLNLLEKINQITNRIKEEKKYSLQKSISLGLQKLMHKKEFISRVEISIKEDVMDIKLLDSEGGNIDKDTLSKGEQQLYATALLNALVDESGIKFPVFIDSPLQKFDKIHAEKIISEFYPSISDQVVLFPLLEKELSRQEYEFVKPNLNRAYLIENTIEGSTIRRVKNDQLFVEFNTEKNVPAY